MQQHGYDTIKYIVKELSCHEDLDRIAFANGFEIFRIDPISLFFYISVLYNTEICRTFNVSNKQKNCQYASSPS